MPALAASRIKPIARGRSSAVDASTIAVMHAGR